MVLVQLTRAWEVMTVGVRVLGAPGANRLLTAAFTCRGIGSDVRAVTDGPVGHATRIIRTLSRERPGGREGEDGSSRIRGFLGLGGPVQDGEVDAEDEEEHVTVATKGSDGKTEINPEKKQQNQQLDRLCQVLV